MKAMLDGDEACIKIGAPGEHLAMNALGALACVAHSGADIGRAVLALASWSPPDGRGKRARITLSNGSEITLLDESYNANPASLGAALTVLAAAEPGDGVHRKGRRVAFLGDMLELGSEEIALHAKMADHPAMLKVDRVHCCGPLMKSLYDALPVDKQGTYCANSVQLAQAVEKAVDAGDVCMVKGSLGSAMRHVTAAIRSLGTEPSDPDERAGEGV